MSQLGITLAGEPLHHRLYHFRLPFSASPGEARGIKNENPIAFEMGLQFTGPRGGLGTGPANVSSYVVTLAALI